MFTALWLHVHNYVSIKNDLIWIYMCTAQFHKNLLRQNRLLLLQTLLNRRTDPSTMSQWLPSKQGNCQNGTAICFYMQTTPETKLVHHRNSQSPQNGGFVIHNNPNLWYSVHKTKSQRACIPVLCNKEEDRFINHQLWFLLDSLSSKPSNHCQNLTNIDPDCIKYRPKT